MLSLFPQLLVYSFFAPTLLRITAACIFFYLVIFHTRNRKEVAREISVLSYPVAIWVSSLFILIEFGVGLLLLIGLLTQLAALIGIIICLKIVLIKRGLRHISPLSHLTYILLIITCLSLLISGAGAIAIDLPL